MTQTTSPNWDVALILPLGVVAGQLLKIGAQLRQLNMKALDLAALHSGGPAGEVGARLDHISEELESIARLVSVMQSDLRPRLRPQRED